METEYAFTALDRKGNRVESLSALQTMMELAQASQLYFPDGSMRGMFFGSGARFYVDVPDHPEFTTPEVTNPWDAVRYLQAGDRLLEQFCAEIPRHNRRVHDVFLTRCNVDYSGAGTTIGSHESHLHHTPNLEHLAGELLLLQTGTRALHVPYNAFPQAISDLLAGRVEFMFAATPPVVGHIAEIGRAHV